MIQVFVDLDGVVFDFDKHFEELIGQAPQEYKELHRSRQFWEKIWETDPDFFLNLDLMPDANKLLDGAVDLTIEFDLPMPRFLSGIPFPNADLAREQKQFMVDKHFPEIELTTCRSHNKRYECKPGDVIIDDLTKYIDLWEGAGGKFILHTSAKKSLREMRKYLKENVV